MTTTPARTDALDQWALRQGLAPEVARLPAHVRSALREAVNAGHGPTLDFCRAHFADAPGIWCEDEHGRPRFVRYEDEPASAATPPPAALASATIRPWAYGAVEIVPDDPEIDPEDLDRALAELRADTARLTAELAETRREVERLTARLAATTGADRPASLRAEIRVPIRTGRHGEHATVLVFRDGLLVEAQDVAPWHAPGRTRTLLA